jgi:hypothetical protein
VLGKAVRRQNNIFKENEYMIAFSQRAFLLNEETGATKMGPWRPLTPLSLIVEDKSNICKLQNAISKELGMEGFFAN